MITYQIGVKDDVLHVVTSDFDENLQEVQNYFNEILNHCIENQCSRVLLDERNLQYTLSIIDTFLLAETEAHHAIGLVRIAIVCDEKYLNDGKFFETAAINRGMHVFVTSDFDNAVEWLNKKVEI